MGWIVGLEPTTSGTTIRRSNQLNYTHHVSSMALLPHSENHILISLQNILNS